MNFEALWFVGPHDQSLNDCLVHALNYAVGFPYFVCREQLLRVVQAVLHLSRAEVLRNKSQRGINIGAFHGAIADRTKVYDIVCILDLKMRRKMSLTDGLR